MASIFSTYSTGENRVTASFLAVLQSLSLDRIQRLLGALTEDPSFELVRFDNQPSKGGVGVPDAIIQSCCRILVETKIVRNTVGAGQIERHLKRLDGANETTAILLVITPDDQRPTVLDSFDDQRIAWASFVAFDQAIDEMLDDKYEVISEREEFLLRSLQKMFQAEDLLASANDTVVVAARKAWPEYQTFHAYVCQPGRPFQHVGRLGFYSQGNVYPLIPKIISVHDEVEMTLGKHEGELGKLVDRLIEAKLRQEGNLYKVFLLSPPDAPDTIQLDAPIPNDLKAKTGKGTAYTMGHRYVSSETLLAAKTTSDLT